MKFLLLLIPLFLFHPAFAQDEDEELIHDLEKDRQQQMNKAVQADNARMKVEDNLANSFETLKSQISEMDEKAIKKLQVLFEESKLGEQDREVLKNSMRAQMSGKPAGKIMEHFPVLLDILVDVMRDKHAMPKLLGVFLRKPDLKKYGFIALFILILGFLIRKYVFNPDWGFFVRLFMRVSLSIVLGFLSLFIFYLMFTEEVGPLVAVISKHI